MKKQKHWNARFIILVALSVFSTTAAYGSHTCDNFYSKLSRCQPYTCTSSYDLSGMPPEMKAMLASGGVEGAPPIPPAMLNDDLSKMDFRFQIIGRVGESCHYKESAIVDDTKVEGRECFLTARELDVFSNGGPLPPVLPEEIAKNCKTHNGSSSLGHTGSAVGSTGKRQGPVVNTEPVVIEQKEGSQYEWYQ